MCVHVYSVGKYTVTVRVYNRLGGMNASITVFILDKLCYKPEIKVHGTLVKDRQELLVQVRILYIIKTSKHFFGQI